MRINEFSTTLLSLRPAVTTRRNRGAILISVVIVFLLLVGFVGLALDTALIRKTTQELQAAADGSALAATRALAGDTEANQWAIARQAAVDCALSNKANGTDVQIEINLVNGPTGDVVVGTWDRDTRTFTITTVDTESFSKPATRTQRWGVFLMDDSSIAVAAAMYTWNNRDRWVS